MILLPNVGYDKVWSCYVVCFILAFSLMLVRKRIFKTFMAPCRHCARHCSIINALTLPVKAYNLSRRMERPRTSNDVTRINHRLEIKCMYINTQTQAKFRKEKNDMNAGIPPARKFVSTLTYLIFISSYTS